MKKQYESLVKDIIDSSSSNEQQDEKSERINREIAQIREILDRDGIVYNKTTPCLIRRKNGEKFLVNRQSYILGRDRFNADGCLDDNPLIARKHVIFTKENGKWKMMDMNSSNGTYLNGGRLPSNQKVQIEDGDVLMIGDEDFEIHFI